MSHNPKEAPIPCHPPNNSAKTMLEERKVLLSDFGVKDGEKGELPHLGDEECPGPRERTPLQKSRIVGMARSLAALVLGTMLLVPMSRSWCGRMSAASQLTDTPKLLSNGTHEFEHTVLIVSIDGLR